VRCIAAATMVALVAASIGTPDYAAVLGKDLSQPFPCMHRKCGCKDAATCWNGCCCFTAREKLAWAAKNNVTAPHFVAEAAAHEPAAKTSASCCSSNGGKSCAAMIPAKGRAKDFTAVIVAAKCHGEVEQWLVIGASDLVQPEPWHEDQPWIGSLVVISESHDSTASAPPTPPPWC